MKKPTTAYEVNWQALENSMCSAFDEINALHHEIYTTLEKTLGFPKNLIYSNPDEQSFAE